MSYGYDYKIPMAQTLPPVQTYVHSQQLPSICVQQPSGYNQQLQQLQCQQQPQQPQQLRYHQLTSHQQPQPYQQTMYESQPATYAGAVSTTNQPIQATVQPRIDDWVTVI